MSCPYYTFRYGEYYCIKACKDVKDDAYSKYCRNYDYDDCPAYKMSSEYKSDYEYLSMYKGNSDDDDRNNSSDSRSESSGSGCFLTSACTAARGLPDDCHELTVLRDFRDNWLKHQPDGILLIAHYYEVAPKIVESIDKREDRLEIWDRIYRELVIPCVEMIEKGENQQALALYQKTTLHLSDTYC